MELAQRIARLEAIEAIKQLKAQYAKVCDDGYKPDGMLPLFTEDAVWEDTSGAFGRFVGREAICEFFRGVSEPISWALHYMIAPRIVVDDDLQRASGDWYIFMPATIDGEPIWLMGTYRERYRSEGGTWKFCHLVANIQAITPFAGGWVETPFIGG